MSLEGISSCGNRVRIISTRFFQPLTTTRVPSSVVVQQIGLFIKLQSLVRENHMKSGCDTMASLLVIRWHVT